MLSRAHRGKPTNKWTHFFVISKAPVGLVGNVVSAGGASGIVAKSDFSPPSRGPRFFFLLFLQNRFWRFKLDVWVSTPFASTRLNWY